MPLGDVAGWGQIQADTAFGADPEPQPHIPSAPVTQNARDLTPQDVADQLQQLGDDTPQ